MIREYEKIYKLVDKSVSEKKYKAKFKDLINVRKFSVKKNKDESQMFLKLGKILAILTALDITEIFFNDIIFRKSVLLINFGFINMNKIEKYNYKIMTSLDICNGILDSLCYREEGLYNKNTCNEFIYYIKEGWEFYSGLFMYSYRNTYRLINFNERLFNSIAEGEFYIKHKILSNLYKLNKYDLSVKSSIIEMEFDDRKNKSFKLQSILLNDSTYGNALIEEIERISDIITRESKLGINNSTICRSWIGYKISENNEIKFDILNLDYKTGIIGISYFYLKLFELTKNKYYIKLAKESINEYKYNFEANNNKNEIMYIFKYIYELTKDKEYESVYLKNKLTDKEINDEELKFKNAIPSSCILLKNSLDKYFLGIDMGLSGYGLYLINKYLNN